MKQQIFQKLTSRKLWVAIIGIVVGLATAFGIEENDYVQIAGVVGSICSGIAYILGEASIDKAKLSETYEEEETELIDEESFEGDVF